MIAKLVSNEYLKKNYVFLARESVVKKIKQKVRLGFKKKQIVLTKEHMYRRS